MHLDNIGAELDCNRGTAQMIRKESGHAAASAANDDDG
jgi:hypothetical protein